MASIKYKTSDGYVSIPMTVPTKSNEENGNGIGTCDTSSGTSLEVTLSGYELVTNGFVAVTFEYDVPAGATLNVNSKGVKPIIYKGAAIEADTIKADDTVMFCYDGTNYVVTSLGLVIKPSFITGYIILDQTSSDPTTKVLDENGHGYANYQRPNVITAIRNASHRYVGTFANNIMSLKQLDDMDGTKYADGTSAATDIATQGKDVFMRLPYFFTRVSEVATDKIKIEFAFDSNQTTTSTSLPIGENWRQWGGNDLIGVYKCSASNTQDNENGYLYSNSGKTIVKGISINNFTQKAKNRGSSFSLVKWRHHCIMSILFYAYYGNTNSASLVGVGTTTYNTTGLRNTLGMTDTNSTNGNVDFVNFWGLESWWGYDYEFFDKDNVLCDNGNFYIKEDDGTIRIINNVLVTSSSGLFFPNKYIIGDNLDIVVPATEQTSATTSTGYCSFVNTANGNTIRRSAGSSSSGVGVAGYNYAPLYDSRYTTRLAYTGTIKIV